MICLKHFFANKEKITHAITMDSHTYSILFWWANLRPFYAAVCSNLQTASVAFDD